MVGGLGESLEGLVNAKHLVLALGDPVIEEEVGDFDIFLLVFEAAQDHTLNEMRPVGDAFHQLVLLPEHPVLLQNALLHLFQRVGVVLSRDPFACEDVHDFLYVEFVLLLAAVFGLFGRRSGLFQRQFRELVLQFVVALLVGVEEQYLEEEVEEIDDGVGVGEELVVGESLPGDAVGLPAHPPLELLELAELLREDQMCDEQVEQLLLYFRVYQDFIREVRQG